MNHLYQPSWKEQSAFDLMPPNPELVKRMNKLAYHVLEAGGFCDQETMLMAMRGFRRETLVNHGSRVGSKQLARRLKQLDRLDYATYEPLIQQDGDSVRGNVSVILPAKDIYPASPSPLHYHISHNGYKLEATATFSTLTLHRNTYDHLTDEVAIGEREVLHLKRFEDDGPAHIDGDSVLDCAVIGMKKIRQRVAKNQSYIYDGMVQEIDETYLRALSAAHEYSATERSA